MVSLYTLTHGPYWMAFVGCCALAVLAALIRNINAQEKDVLPPPTSPVTERLWRVRHDAWSVSPGHVRFDNQGE